MCQQINGLRLLKPPYGRITGYDMNQGTIAFQIPNGDTPPNIKAAFEAAGLKDIPPTGSPSQAHLLVTKNFLFATEGSGGQAILHAYDKKTGAPIWQAQHAGGSRNGNSDGLRRIRVSSTSFMRPAARKVAARSLSPGRLRLAPAGAGGGGGAGGGAGRCSRCRCSRRSCRRRWPRRSAVVAALAVPLLPTANRSRESSWHFGARSSEFANARIRIRRHLEEHARLTVEYLVPGLPFFFSSRLESVYTIR